MAGALFDNKVIKDENTNSKAMPTTLGAGFGVCLNGPNRL
jgi:hypothetical protein